MSEARSRLRGAITALVTPFRYTALVWAALLGFAIWGDVPDNWTILGAMIIVAAGVYLFSRLFGYFSLSPTAMAVCLAIGTAMGAALAASGA